MAFSKLLLTLLPLFLQICTTTPLLGTDQEVLKDGPIFANSVRKAYAQSPAFTTSKANSPSRLKKSDIIPDGIPSLVLRPSTPY
jgi:hypothetical protein